MFSVNLTLVGGEYWEVGYFAIYECLNDNGLKSIFDDELVKECSVHIGGKRITAIPLMEWSRLVDCVISNSVVILRHLQGG